MRGGSAQILQPIMTVEVTIPEEYQVQLFQWMTLAYVSGTGYR